MIFDICTIQLRSVAHRWPGPRACDSALRPIVRGGVAIRSPSVRDTFMSSIDLEISRGAVGRPPGVVVEVDVVAGHRDIFGDERGDAPG